jgi:YARHG domain
MRNVLILAVVVCTTIVGVQPGHARQLLESYTALLSERDHFNSTGQRLTTAAAIIRQDRANFHRFGLRDPADEDDAFFADEGNRAALERLLEHGRAEPGVISRIVNSTPLLRVEVWQSSAGPFVVVTLIRTPTTGGESEPGAVQEEPAAQQQLSELSCDQLWFARNSIFKAAGFCFKTSRAISAFGTAGCLYDNEHDVPLSQKDRNVVEAIQGEERYRQCR